MSAKVLGASSDVDKGVDGLPTARMLVHTPSVVFRNHLDKYNKHKFILSQCHTTESYSNLDCRSCDRCKKLHQWFDDRQSVEAESGPNASHVDWADDTIQNQQISETSSRSMT